MQTTWKHTFIGAVLGILLPVVNGFAISPPNGIAPLLIPAGGFAIEGNLLANTPTSGVGDWIAITNSFPGAGGGVLAANGTPLNAATTFHFVDPYAATNDTIMIGGDASGNPNAWTWGTDTVLNKEDMNNGLVHVGRDAANHVWVVVSADHTGTGDADMYFYFLQNVLSKNSNNSFNTNGTFSSAGPHAGFTMGDLRLKLNFSGSSFLADRWQTNTSGGGYKWVDVTTSLPAGRVFMAVNPGNTYVPYGTFGSTNYLSENFIEAAVDFSVLVGGTDPCASIGFKNVFIATLHPSGTMSDFINPIPASFTVGLAPDAGADQIKCYADALTTFSLNGGVSVGGTATLSTNWSVISGDAIIDSPGSLNTTVQVPSTAAGTNVTLRLTVTSACTNKTDDVVLSVQQTPVCAITGPTTSCPRTTNTHAAPVGMNSYNWTISGNGSISGPANQQTVKVVAGGLCGQSYTLSLVTSSNVCTVSCSSEVLVTDNTMPVLTCPTDRVLDFPANTTTNATGVATATDSCSRATVAYNDSVTNGCGASLTIARIWIATDECGNTVSATQMITVRDVTAPAITCPANRTLQCPADTSTAANGVATATDLSGSAIVTYNDVVTPACGNTFVITRTWMATDLCNNSSTGVQTITVKDTTAPVIAALPAPTTIDCPATPSFAQATATDTCDQSVTLTFKDVTTPGSHPGNYSVTRTWTATDACGNASTASQTITVQDITAPVIAALPAPTTIDCPATPSFAQATATDTCDQSVTLTFKDVTTPGSHPGNYSVTRTWTATDDSGNFSTASQTINVQDITAPVIAVLPAPTTIDCPATPSFAQATATDTCDQSVTLTFKDVTTPGSHPGNYAVTRTWTATDVSGNFSTASQTITVQDITAPVIAALPAPTTIDCPATPSFAQATATDTCDQSVTLTFKDVTTPGSHPGNYSVTRTWTATDDSGNFSTASQTITVQDVTAPVIAALPAPTTIDCPATPSFAQATATDTCDQSVTLTFKDVTTPGSHPGNYSVTRTWTATDDSGNFSTASQTITVQDITAPVIAALPAPTTIDCPATPSFAQATATDTCDQSVTLTFKDVTTPGSHPGNYSVTRTWTATDDSGNFSTASQTITVQDITAPVIAALPAPTTIDCPATPSFAQATATDTCDQSVTLTFKDVTTPGSHPGNYAVTRTWTATDDSGNFSTASQTITVQDVTAPVIAALPAPTTIDCPATPSFAQATATDTCDQSVTLTFKDVTTPGSHPGNYSVTRTWTATDDSGNFSTASQTINVQDITAPVIAALPAPTTIDCPATPSFAQATATDTCDQSVTLTFKDVTTPGSHPGNYSVTRTWTATDDSGNFSTASQTINVQDITAPAIAALPAPTTIDCPATPSFAQATATDTCDQSVTLTFKDVTTPGSHPGNYSVTRTWTATDDSGNFSTASQTINVQDITAPVIAALPAPTTIDCPATPSFAQATATDTCDQSVTLTFKDVTTPGSHPGNYSVTRTWTATDDSGNSSTASQTITVQDVTAPVIAALPAPTTINCPATPSFAQATATDTCDQSVTLTFKDVTTPGSCPGNHSITRTWTATDDSGNFSTASQTITVQDITPPALVMPANLVLEVPGDTRTNVTGVAIAPDACGSATVSYSEVVSNSCGLSRTIWRLWTAVDQCGNTTNGLQTIVVRDSKPPVVQAPAIAVQCVGDVPAPYANLAAFLAAGGKATDNSSNGMTFALASDSGLVGSCPGTITRIYRVTDACGNFADATQKITVDDTIAPTITCAPSMTVACDASLDPATTGFATATDNCDTNVSVTYSDVALQSSYDINWYAADPAANSAPYLPAYLKLAPGSLPCPTGGRAADPLRNAVAFGPTPGQLDALTSLSGESMKLGQILPFEAVIDVSGAPGPEHGTIEFTASWSTYTTSNDRFGFDKNYKVYCAFVDSADIGSIDPHANAKVESFSSTIINAGTINEKIQGTFRVSGLDTGDRIIVEVWMVLMDTQPDHVGGTIASELVSAQKVLNPPQPISVGGKTISISAHKFDPLPPPQEQPPLPPLPPQPPVPTGFITSVIDRTWTATDVCGNSSSCVQRFTVRDATPPVISVPASVTLEYPADTRTNFTGVAVAQDSCGSVTITYSDIVSNLCGSSKVVSRLWTATDEWGNRTNAVQTITVQDITAPVIAALPAATTINCPATPSFAQATATDTGDPSVTLTFQDVTESGGCPGNYSVTRTWTATDACGNASTASQTITVQDITAPVIAALPAATTINCPATPSFARAVATDTCDQSVTLVFKDVTTPGGCPGNYSVTRTWTATDACGNASTASQTITVQDIAAPVITCPPAITVELGASTSPGVTGTATATDLSGSTIISYSETSVPGCGNSLTITRDWTATDACGNSASCTQIITVLDTTPPTLNSVANKTIAAGEPLVFDVPTATDAGGTAVVSVLSTTTNALSDGAFTVTCTWCATDACGNHCEPQTQTITVLAPSLDRLRIEADGTSRVLLRWPTNATDYRLEFAATPDALRWSPVPVTPINTNGEWRVYLPKIEPGQFYRLANTPPSLEILRLGDGSLSLTWPTAPSGYQLEASETWQSDGWTPVDIVPEVSNALNHVTVTPTEAKKFYRLNK